MNDQEIQSTRRTEAQIADMYLQQVQALGSEITLAMEAIAGNELDGFRNSVCRQEMLCAVLGGMAPAIRNNFGSAGQHKQVGNDRSIEQEIQEASEAVRQLNLQYAALLKHSGRSIALLASLCKSHTGQFQEARGPRLKRQTWSCEM